jgi:membrane fusion protein (multidrug efflux system)
LQANAFELRVEMKRSVKITIFILIILLIGIIVLWSPIKALYEGDSEKTSSHVTAKRAPLQVSAMVIDYEALDDEFFSIGSILPAEEVSLSFETSGKITQINFEEGTSVTKGQLLAKVNDAPLQAQLQKLQAQLPLAKDRVYRQKTLLEKDAVSKEAYEQVNTDLATLEADIDLVKAQIAQTELRAPFDGVIGLRAVSEGQYVTQQTNIAKLTQISPLKIEFAINEHQANSLHNGSKVHFNLQGDEKTYEATVYARNSEVDPTTRTLTIRALYNNADHKILPGRSVSIKVALQQIPNAIAIPTESMISELGRDLVYVYRKGVAQHVDIIKGLRTDSKIQVIEGLEKGDTLITSGTMQLRDGTEVNLTITTDTTAVSENTATNN